MTKRQLIVVFALLALCLPRVSLAAGNNNSQKNTGDLNRLNQIARDQQADLEQRSLLLQDADLDRYLTELAQKLWANTHSELPPIQIRVVRHPAPDAYMYPNGVCYLHTGLLANLENEDQLAMAIAHEMIHYLRQHTLLAYQSSLQGSRSYLLNDTQHKNTFDHQGRSLADLLQSTELQADREGLALIAAAGYRSSESIGLLNILKSITDDQETKAASKSTKPILNHRLEQLRLAIANQRYPAPANSQKIVAGTDFYVAILPSILANARAASQMGDWEIARHDIERYIRFRPDEPGAYCLRGEIFYKSAANGQHDKALASFDRAIALNRQYAPAYRAMGLIYFKAGHMEKARNYLQAYIDIAPESAEKKYIHKYLSLCND
ncbi:MAG: tetratricopeptide repeat protein [Desulfobacteraceae bacterium]|nr:tetratricopeptide repeat protein [Desulfobacteraceae bacterium]